VPNPEPSDLEVAKLLASISRRIARLAKHHDIELDRPNEQVECLDPLASESPLLAGICGASVLGRIATGVRAGQPVLRIGRRADAPLVTRSGKRQAHSEGFDLHVNVAVPAGDRTRLEHLSRYVLRPPIAQDAIELATIEQPAEAARRRPIRARVYTTSSISLLRDRIERQAREQVRPRGCAHLSLLKAAS
jgi:Putative transposase